MRDRLKDILTRHCITVKATEYFFGRRKLSRISLILPAGYEGQEFVIMPREVLEQLKRELRLTELTLRLCYGKYIGASFYREIRDSLDLDDKVELSYRIIEEAIRVVKLHCKTQNITVAFSGGKASLATLKLVVDVLQQQDPELLREKFYVCYNDTGIEYPENTPYVVKVVKEHFKLPRLVITRCRIKPFQLWKTFGFPPESRYHHREPVCCMVLKKLPVAIVVKKFGIDLQFVGLQVFESRIRIAVTDRLGLVAERTTVGGVQVGKWFYYCTPVAFWSEEDIWQFIEKENLPVNPVYDRYGIPRQGCMFCTNHLGWEKRIRHILCNVLKRPQAWEWFINVYRRWGVQKQRRISVSEVMRRFGYKKLEDMYIIRVI